MKTITVFLLFVLFQISAFAQDQETITKAFETGNVTSLSSYFDDNVDLTILESEGIYSKAQAKVILQNFFSSNSPGVFTIKHQGGSDNSKYVIGTLVSNGNSYRIYFLFKSNNSTTLIQKLRIEND